MLTVERRSQLLNAVDADDRGAGNSDELGRVQLRLEPVHRLAHEMRMLADMEGYVVSRRLAPVDVGRPHEVDAPAGLDHEPIERAGALVDVRQQREQLAADRRRMTLRELLA